MENRTGHLAGLWKILKSRHSMKNAFYNQMCENGYGGGNPNKPHFVVSEIRKGLTPIFIYMANLISKKKITLGNLIKDYCKDKLPRVKALICQDSSKFP